MGFLKSIGKVMTYNEYKNHIDKYKEHGLN